MDGGYFRAVGAGVALYRNVSRVYVFQTKKQNAAYFKRNVGARSVIWGQMLSTVSTISRAPPPFCHPWS